MSPVNKISRRLRSLTPAKACDYQIREMIKSTFKTLFLIFTFCALVKNAYPGDIHPTCVDFLKFGIGARPSAMGEASVSLHSDVTAAYWNPAGLAKIKRIQCAAMYSEAVKDAFLNFFGVAVPVKGWGTYEVSGVFLFIDPLPVTDTGGKTLGNLRWTDWAFALSYGKEVMGGLSLGLAFKVIQRIESDPIFGTTKGTAYSGDFGLIYEFPFAKGLNLGSSLLNVGNRLQMEGEIKKDDLPRTTRLGLSYNKGPWIITSDINKVLDDRWRIHIGGEHKFKDTIFLRFGYYEKAGNVRGATYGMGIKLKNYQFDWANVPASEMIGYTRDNKISLIIHF